MNSHGIYTPTKSGLRRKPPEVTLPRAQADAPGVTPAAASTAPPPVLIPLVGVPPLTLSLWLLSAAVGILLGTIAGLLWPLGVMR